MRKIAESLAGCAAVVQINTQDSPNIGGRFGVRGIPAVYLLRNGNVVDKISGSRSAEEMVEWFRRRVECA